MRAPARTARTRLPRLRRSGCVPWSPRLRLSARWCHHVAAIDEAHDDIMCLGRGRSEPRVEGDGLARRQQSARGTPRPGKDLLSLGIAHHEFDPGYFDALA